MSFLGSMKFVLKVRDHRVTDVEIKLPKEIKVEDLVRGRSPQEAFDIFQTIFALCPNSQLAAAKLACAATTDEDPDQELIAQCRFANHLEIIREGTLFFTMRCAGRDFLSTKSQSLINVRALCEELKELPYNNLREREKLWASLRSEVSYLLLDGFSNDWEQDLYNGTIETKPESLSGFFAKISKTQRTKGWCPAPLLTKSPTFILQALKEKGCWDKEPWNIEVDALTGPVARMSHRPSEAGLLAQDGNTNYTRIAARFMEVLSAADLVRIPFETVSAIRLSNGAAASLVQNSRGILLHTVRLEGRGADAKIKDYSILTPTDINVVRSKWFKQALMSLKFDDAAALKEAADFTILSFDPCTAFEVEVCHA